jgi:hypothetical protein
MEIPEAVSGVHIANVRPEASALAPKELSWKRDIESSWRGEGGPNE